MLKFKNYVKAASLEEAFTLKQKKGSVVLGGMLWLKMQNRTVNTAIDLSGLGLDTIEEDEQEFRIGCMVTLRQLETDPAFNRYTNGMAREAVRHIVGVQFRNLATVGGSLFGRYGFSDVLSFFMALPAEVELYQKGRVPIAEFARMKWDRDLLVRVIVKKVPLAVSYLTQRNTQTDFPVLTCCISQWDGMTRVVIGARPARAVLVVDEQGLYKNDGDWKALIAYVKEQVVVGSNMRASAEYRRHLIGVLIRRAGAALEVKE